MLSFSSHPLMVVVVTNLLVLPWRIRANTLNAIPEKNVKVVYQQESRTSSNIFSIVADMPVIVNRYDNTRYLIGTAPVEDRQVFVYVKTDDKNRCKDDDLVKVTYGLKNDRSRVATNVTIQGGNRVRSNKYLNTSSAFDAQWRYFFVGLCGAEQDWRPVEAEEEENNGSNRRRRLSSAESRLPTRKVPASRPRHLQDESPTSKKRTKKCKATVEIVTTPCGPDLEVLAPKIRVMEFGTESNHAAVENKDDTCRATISFPTRSQTIPKAKNSAYLPHLSYRKCSRPILGRPFVDSSSEPMVASIHMSDTATWAREELATRVLQTKDAQPTAEQTQTCAESEKLASSNISQNSSSPVLKVASEGVPRSLIASTWTRRGLGEHASIASFAVFTLELMTNNAPPSLVRDALAAALDEFNHATTSFQVASLFAETNVEPGALPPSSHSFDRDLESLALGAAREGCIDETLSALAAALEADFYGSSDALLSDKLRGIARDEARHSALAWRTVRWVCSIDEKACDAVKREAFSAAKLSSAIKRHVLPWGGSLEKEWKLIYETLVPLVTGNDGNTSNDDSGGDDTKEEQKTTSQEAAQEIIRAVVCDDGT